MIRRSLPVLTALAALVGCAPVPPPPVCAQPEVLQLLSERMRHAGRGQLVEPGSINERPGSRPGLVHCAARVEVATYDITRFGSVPVITVNVVQYAVELRRNGVFLLPEPVPLPWPPGGSDQVGVARRSM